MSINKPFSQACENNKAPILAQLQRIFKNTEQVLEIGSGTGQHAAFFAPRLPHLLWQTSDLPANHDSIELWLQEVQCDTLLPPLSLDIGEPWPVSQPDGMFTANTLHIVSEALVEAFFAGVSEHLPLHGQLCIYGPFKYQGQFTSASNAQFDAMLKQRDPRSGIREQQWLVALAKQAGLTLIDDVAMPANNQLLHFERTKR